MTIDLYQYHSNPEQLIYYDKAYDYVPCLIWDKYGDQFNELKKREDILARDPWIAYLYAFYDLEGPFKKGEDIIAKNSRTAYGYAKFILKDRFEKGEDAIAKDPLYVYMYARSILEGRFKKGEESILNSIFADDYKQFLKERNIDI